MNVEVCNLSAFPIQEAAVKRLAEATLAAERVEGSVEVAFVEAAEMARLNGEYRGSEGPTDVLSFSYAGDEADDERWPQTAETGEDDCVGEVVIAPEVAMENAAQDGTSSSRELATLVIHGLLHLAGHDHETDQGEMLARQGELLALLWEDDSMRNLI